MKVAVLGVGHLGKFHARILSSMPGVDLVGVVDVRREVAQQVASQCATQAFTDYRKVLGCIDAAVLAVPTRLHYQLGCELLDRGIHTLIEKPLALNAAEGEELVELAQTSKAVLAVGHVEKFNPAWQAVVADAKSPRVIEAHRLCRHTFRSTDIGVVLDLMIHDLDLTMSLVKQPVTDIDSVGMAVFGEEEDVANVRVSFADGCVATLNASRASYTAERSMQIWTDHACYDLDFGSKTAKVVRPTGTKSAAPHTFEDHLKQYQLTPASCDQLTAELEDFVHAIRSGSSPRTSGPEALQVLTVAEEIITQMQLHPWPTPSPSPLRGPHWSLAKRLGRESSTPELRLRSIDE